MTQGSRLRGMMVCLLLVLASALSLLPHFRNSAELVRMRNALLMDFVDTPSFDWSPSAPPADFDWERAAPWPQFVARVQALGLEALPGDWERALAIGRHMLHNRIDGDAYGIPIQSDLERTYVAIVDKGMGYCADFSDVYDALALAAGLKVRTWAFSFEGFGGRGHIFNEVWDVRRGRWLMIDVVNNLYPVDEQGEPMSGLEYRERLRAGGTAPQAVRIEPRALAVFTDGASLARYYRRGLNQWYMWWGNAVYSYDNALLVRLLGPVSRSLEQLGAILHDVHPHIRVLAEADNRAMVQRMWQLRVHLLVVLAVCVAAVLAAAVLLAGYVRAARQARVPLPCR